MTYLDPTTHYIQLDEDGWVMQHPLRCRPDLLSCKFTKAARDTTALAIDPADWEAGRHAVILDGHGIIVPKPVPSGQPEQSFTVEGIVWLTTYGRPERDGDKAAAEIARAMHSWFGDRVKVFYNRRQVEPEEYKGDSGG